MNEGPGHTDLFPRNSALREYLPRYDVLHITDPFTLCRTAAGYAQKHGVPLVKSVHTHLPEFTRVYSTEMLKKFSGGWSALEWLLLKQLRLHDRFAAGMARRLEKLVRRCDAVLVSDDRYRDWTRQVHPDAPLFSLRRGIDKERFHPRHANREGLRQLGVPANKIILLFVGRVDDSKNVMTVARATRALVDQGHPVHLIVAGEGARRREVRDLLGRHVTAPGMLPQEKLNWLYASSDLFAFPSQSETFGNVMLEARASGCPVMVPASSLSVRFVEEPGFDGFLVEDCEPESWFRALEPLVQNPALLARAGEAAWQRVQRQWPSWLDVVREDLLPVWRDMAEIGTEFQVPAETTLPSSSRKKFKAA